MLYHLALGNMGNSIYAGPMWHSGMYLLIELRNYTMLLFMLSMSFSVLAYLFDTNNILSLSHIYCEK